MECMCALCVHGHYARNNAVDMQHVHEIWLGVDVINHHHMKMITAMLETCAILLVTPFGQHQMACSDNDVLVGL